MGCVVYSRIFLVYSASIACFGSRPGMSSLAPATAVEIVRKIIANSPAYQPRFEVFPKFIHLPLYHYMASDQAVYQSEGLWRGPFFLRAPQGVRFLAGRENSWQFYADLAPGTGLRCLLRKPSVMTLCH